MLHILLTILKIIGIILLVIIGLVLLICSCILFVPIRYSARVKYNETPDICVRVTYLLRLISIKYALIGKDKQMYIKIFGIDINKFKRKKNNKKSNKRSKEELSNKNSSNKKSSKNKSSKNKSSKKKLSEEKLSIDETNDLDENEPSIDIFEEVKEEKYIDRADEELKKAAKENMKVKDDDVETIEEFVKSTEQSSVKKEKISLYQKIKNKIISLKNKIIYRFKSICGKIKNAITKLKEFKEFIQDEHTKSVFILLKGELIKLLKYIKPRKIKGYVNFGFDDPSTTGKILGVYYAVMKGCPKKFSINPDFENKRLETDVFFKGRIRLYYVLYIVIRVYLNEDFKYVLKHRK